jgi:DNA-binding MurR/RpiR family transcriptional regulator
MSDVSRERDRELRSPAERFSERLQPRTSSLILRSRLIEREQQNMQDAFAQFAADDDIAEAAALIVAARRRFIAGYGKSFAYATLLSWDLSVGLSQVLLVDDGNVRLVDVLSDVRSSDVLVAFSFRRYQRKTVTLVQEFAEAGGAVVVVTDDADAPAAQYAAKTLIVPTGSASYVDSPTAVAALVHLLSALSTASAKGARRRIAQRDRLSQVLDDYVD